MMFCLPSGKLTQLWKITTFSRYINHKLPFSIAMLVHLPGSALLAEWLSGLTTVELKTLADALPQHVQRGVGLPSFWEVFPNVWYIC